MKRTSSNCSSTTKRSSKDTPHTNLHVAVLDKLGIPVERFGDSTGKLDYRSGV